MNNHTKLIQFKNLENNQSAITVIRLMMLCNDLQCANEGLKKSKNSEFKSKAAGMYFVRIQIAHLNEGIDIFEKIATDNELINLLIHCDDETKKSFDYVKENIPKVKKYTAQIRNNIVFHYNDNEKRIKEAISNILREEPNKTGNVIKGNHAHLWHFEVADQIVDNIVVEEIFDIKTSGKKRLEESDRKMQEIHELLVRYMDFAGEFICLFFERMPNPPIVKCI